MRSDRIGQNARGQKEEEGRQQQHQRPGVLFRSKDRPDAGSVSKDTFRTGPWVGKAGAFRGFKRTEAAWLIGRQAT